MLFLCEQWWSAFMYICVHLCIFMRTLPPTSLRCPAFLWAHSCEQRASLSPHPCSAGLRSCLALSKWTVFQQWPASSPPILSSQQGSVQPIPSWAPFCCPSSNFTAINLWFAFHTQNAPTNSGKGKQINLQSLLQSLLQHLFILNSFQDQEFLLHTSFLAVQQILVSPSWLFWLHFLSYLGFCLHHGNLCRLCDKVSKFGLQTLDDLAGIHVAPQVISLTPLSSWWMPDSGSLMQSWYCSAFNSATSLPFAARSFLLSFPVKVAASASSAEMPQLFACSPTAKENTSS